MEHINRMIKTNNHYQACENYDKKMKGISRITNWHETKAKFDRANQTKLQNLRLEQEVKFALSELKKARNVRLAELYKQEADQWEEELAARGLAVYKNKA